MRKGLCGYIALRGHSVRISVSPPEYNFVDVKDSALTGECKPMKNERQCSGGNEAMKSIREGGELAWKERCWELDPVYLASSIILLLCVQDYEINERSRDHTTQPTLPLSRPATAPSFLAAWPQGSDLHCHCRFSGLSTPKASTIKSRIFFALKRACLCFTFVTDFGQCPFSPVHVSSFHINSS